MSGNSSPTLSVVMVAYGDSQMLRMALRSWQNQSISYLIEFILVTPSIEKLTLSSEQTDGFFKFTVLETGPLTGEGSAKAAGISASSAPFVVLAEEHSFPERAYAESVVQAHHRGNFAVVGPVMRNANPGSTISWGCFLVFYGSWMAADPDVTALPANQSCYRRDILLQYGSNLARMLESETRIHWDLREKGHRLHQESTARMHHLNFSVLAPLLYEYFLSSRIFAANRAENWSSFKKMIYFLGSPLIPLVRVRRILKYAKQAGLPFQVAGRAMFPMMLNLCSGSAGEMLGYAFGRGDASKRLVRFESSHHLHFTSTDLKAASVL